jgi:aryl-alcohol dehydrogenase-like predicted oxidoreductase
MLIAFTGPLARPATTEGTFTMRHHALGRTGLFVSELCLGTMTFGGSDGIWSQIGDLRQSDAERLVGQALDAGINFIDTADVYAGGVSEQITGQALKNLKVPRDSVVVATKVTGETGPGPNDRGASRGHILAGVQASLKRLQLGHIDLYQIHGFDPATPIEETVRALDQLVRQGDVRYVGVSNWAAWQIAKALGIAERLNLARFESLQAYYTVAGRDLERELVPMLKSEGVGLMVWSPLAGGLLSGKYGREQQAEDGARRTKFDFPPVNRDRAGARRLGGAGRAGVAAAPAAGHQRDRRCQAARAARRQSGGHAARLERGRAASA